MQTFDYIVVGAGLAGCLITWRLNQAGQTAILIGDTQLPNASESASGIINPVTGRWMTKSWKFDTLRPHALATYHELEQRFAVKLFHPVPFFRYCQNSVDKKRVVKRMRNPRYANVLGEYVPAGEGPEVFNDTHGSFYVKQTAYVDLPLLLQTLRKHFLERALFRDISFVYDRLNKQDKHWRYQDLRANHVIFCEGTGMRANPWFNWLPLTPAKGETLTITCPTLNLPNAIYLHRKWLLSYGDNRFRLGATFDSTDLSFDPTEAGADELLQAARSFIGLKHTLEVKAHTCGLRPCTEDFRPFIGSHPIETGLHIFNGLGSKGTLQAPELVRRFLAYLLEKKTLDREIDIARYIHLKPALSLKTQLETTKCTKKREIIL